MNAMESSKVAHTVTQTKQHTCGEVSHEMLSRGRNIEMKYKRGGGGERVRREGAGQSYLFLAD